MKNTEENLRTPLESFAILVANDSEIITKQNEHWDIPLLVGTESEPGRVINAVLKAQGENNLSLAQLQALYVTGRIGFNTKPTYEFYIEDGKTLEEASCEAFSDLVTQFYTDAKMQESELDFGYDYDSTQKELFRAARPLIHEYLTDSTKRNYDRLLILGNLWTDVDIQDAYIKEMDEYHFIVSDLVQSLIFSPADMTFGDTEGQYPEDGGPSIVASIEVSEPCNPQPEVQKDSPKTQSSTSYRPARRTTETQSDNLVSEVYDAFVTDALRLLALQVIILMPAIAFTPLLTLPMFSVMIIATGLLIVGNSTIGRLVPLKTVELRHRRAGS